MGSLQLVIYAIEMMLVTKPQAQDLQIPRRRWVDHQSGSGCGISPVPATIARAGALSR